MGGGVAEVRVQQVDVMEETDVLDRRPKGVKATSPSPGTRSRG